MRTLELWASGPADPLRRFAWDQAMVGYTARQDQTACLRLHSALEPGVALGRFHRRRSEADSRLTRRLTGGRSTPTGPGLLELTVTVPSSGWLDPRLPVMRPEQVLNRALRPLLSVLRAGGRAGLAGIDAFYPGRDLITVDKKPIGACSFTVFPDGVALVDICIGNRESLATFGPLIDELDRDGVAAIDKQCFADAASLADLGCPERGIEDWLGAFADAATSDWRCESRVWSESPPWWSTFTAPGEAAFSEFLGERREAKPGMRTAAALTMLGVAEASARIEDDRLVDVELAGDIMAPATTVAALADACEGQVARAAAIRRCVTSVLAQESHFLLALDSPDELICRLL